MTAIPLLNAVIARYKYPIFLTSSEKMCKFSLLENNICHFNGNIPHSIQIKAKYFCIQSLFISKNVSKLNLRIKSFYTVTPALRIVPRTQSSANIFILIIVK